MFELFNNVKMLHYQISCLWNLSNLSLKGFALGGISNLFMISGTWHIYIEKSLGVKTTFSCSTVADGSKILWMCFTCIEVSLEIIVTIMGKINTTIQISRFNYIFSIVTSSLYWKATALKWWAYSSFFKVFFSLFWFLSHQCGGHLQNT